MREQLQKGESLGKLNEEELKEWREVASSCIATEQALKIVLDDYKKTRIKHDEVSQKIRKKYFAGGMNLIINIDTGIITKG